MQIKLRPEISSYVAVSIDGYIAKKNDDLSWLEEVQVLNKDYYGYKKYIDSIDAMVIGRNTYNKAINSGKWPYKGKRVIVLSNTLSTAHSNVEIFQGDIAQLIQKLHLEEIKHISIDGGITFSEFLNKKMIDQITLLVIPVILGAGVPLFNKIQAELPCRLISSNIYESGLVILNYELIKDSLD